jgi:hypothetical protein
MGESDNIEIYRVSIILTTTVHVTQNTAFQVNKQERINTYLKSIRSWLRNTNLNIIVIENSGYEFTELADELNLYKDRFEVITYTESQSNYKEFQMHLQSKGGLEINSIHYAFNISKILNKSSFIIKITGRFFINNFENFINSIDLRNYDCLKQHFNNRCEIVGTSLRNFDTIFNKNLFVNHGKYDYHVENVYTYRYSLFRNVLKCPIFNIEPTQRGGLNEKYSQL